MFKVDATDLRWLENMDEQNDLCLHGKAVAIIGDETLEYDATVSSTALYLLKSLTENHVIYHDNPMLPCCGHSMYANEKLNNVDIVGCSNGIDWSITHTSEGIEVVTDAGNKTVIGLEDYKKNVYSFVDMIEDYYNKSLPKTLPDDKVDRDGYIAFWNEWRRRRL